MKILVGNNGLAEPGGSETYTYAVCKELKSRGFEVHAIGKLGPGTISKKLNEIGVPTFFNTINGNYDLILLSHSSSIGLAKNTKGFKVQTCHGVYPKLEQPVPGMDAYVSISEEVQEHLLNKGFKSIIIRNGVDCDRFKPVKKLNNNIKNVVSLAHSDPANVIIKKACDELGLNLIENNKFKCWRWDMENVINQGDVVISLGRGAYESMACGRNVIIFDKRRYVNLPAIGDGIITKENVNDFLKNNCSGRFSMKEFSYKTLVDELKKYDSKYGDQLRDYALNHLNIKQQVDKYLKLKDIK